MNKFLLLSFLAVFPYILQAQLYVNEFMAKNSSTITDEFGENDDWIEIYNESSSDINIGGYFITDEVSDFDQYYQIPNDNPSATTVPAGGFLLIWADKDDEQGPLHTDFKLSTDGEHIGFYDGNQVLIDSFSFSTQAADISMGRLPDGGTNMAFFKPATPLDINANVVGGILNPPVFSKEGGFYTNQVTVSISSEAGTEIHYTLDASDPDLNSPLYVGALSIAVTTPLRAVATKAGSLSSRPTSHVFYIDESYELPVLDIITDSSNLYGPLGIYDNPKKKGSNWERFCEPSYFKNENLDFAVDCGIRIQGNSSVTLPKKSFRLFFKKQYGLGKLDYPLFGENNGVDKFKKIVLRSGYDDGLTSETGTLLRDPIGRVFYQLLNRNGLVSNGNWSVLTLNGAYWGVYDIRESVNEIFVEDHLGTDEFDMIRFGKAGPELKYGSIDEWDELTDYIKTHDLTVDANYDYVAERIDIDNLIDLMSLIQLIDYRSWGYGVSTYKKKEEGGKWKWTIWDLDRAFRSKYTNMMEWWDRPIVDLYWANFLPKSLLKNETFRNEFANRQADLLNTVFKEDFAQALLQEQKDIIAPEMQNEIDRWVADSSYASYDWWEGNVAELDELLGYRPNQIRHNMVDFYELDGDKELELSTVGSGSLRINSIDVPTSPWTGYYFEGIPVTITAIPDPGYKFVGWNNGFPDDPTIQVDVHDYEDMEATFELDGPCDRIVITEIMYNPSAENNGKEWVEIYNKTNETVSLDHWIFKDDGSHEFILPANVKIEAESYLVLAENVATFSDFYPDVDNVIGDFGAGENGFGLSNKGDFLHLFTSGGCPVDSVEFDDKDPWPSAADGEGSSLVLKTIDSDNNVATNWMASDVVNGMPGGANFFEVDLGEDFEVACSELEIELDATIEFCTSCTYLWDNNETSSKIIVTPSESTTYSVTVTSGVVAVVDEITIEVNGLIANIESVSLVSCNGLEDGAIEVGVSGGTAPYHYSWSNNSQTEDIDNLKAGDYELTITDDANCETVIAATIIEPDQNDITLINMVNNNCFGESNGAISVEVEGGLEPYEYEWSNDATTSTISDLAANEYQLTVTDANGCRSFFDAEVTAPDALFGSVESITMAACHGDEGAVEVMINGGTTPYQYLWSNEAMTSSISSLDTGVYVLTVTDLNGCSINLSAMVGSISEVSIAQVDLINNSCHGESSGSIAIEASNGLAPYVYQWNTAATLPSIDSLAAGFYSLTVTDANDCETTFEQTITAPEEPVLVIDSIRALQCFGDENGYVAITIEKMQPPLEYDWSNGATTPTLSGLSGGTYSLNITDADNCLSEFELSIAEPEELLVELLTVNNVLCFGEENGVVEVAVNGGVEPYEYQWNTGHNSELLMDVGEGVYSLEVLDVNGCQAILSEVTVVAPDEAFQGNAIIVEPSSGNDGKITIEPVGGIAPYTIDWATSEKTSFTLMELGVGEYIYTIEDSNGCSFMDTIYLKPSAIQEIDGFSDLSIFPNPNSGAFDIQWSSTLARIGEFVIYDAVGHVVWEEAIPFAKQHITLNLKELDTTKSGLFILKISSNEGQILRKIQILP